MAFTQLLIHFIWSTRLRTPWLEAETRPRILAYMAGICRNIRAPLIIAGGIEDHVHLLVDLHPTVAPADAARDIKANSSRFIHETWPRLAGFAWQDSYSGFGVSRSNRDMVYQYIQNQEEHHRVRSFADELREFHLRHGLDWNPDRALG